MSAPVNEPEYETHDINLAAYLAYAGCKLLRKRKEGTRVFFIFQNVGGDMKKLRDAYFSNQGGFYQYAQQLKAFKEMCFD